MDNFNFGKILPKFFVELDDICEDRIPLVVSPENYHTKEVTAFLLYEPTSATYHEPNSSLLINSETGLMCPVRN